MRPISLLFVLLLNLLPIQEEEVKINVIFECDQPAAFKSGIFIVQETDVSLTVKSLEGFEFTLPRKGQYTFLFEAEGFIALVDQPKSVKPGHMEPIKIILVQDAFGYSINYDQAGQPINLNFILHGITNNITSKHAEFSSKYGVGFIFKNCVLDPITTKNTREFNNKVADFLDATYGNEWKKDLPASPFGLSN